MALTKTPIELSSTPSIVDGGNATAITIDSSENTTFAGTVTSGSHITIPATSRLYLDGGGNSFIEETAADTVTITTNNEERLRIKSDGDVLVGTTNADIGGSVTGINLKSTGAGMFSMDETGTYNQPLYADRRGTNNTGTVLAMGMGGFFKAAIDIHGTNAGTNDAAISFNTWSGNATKTEKMRVLSGGGITFNGDTAAANALDDYEEGSWTPVLDGLTAGDYTMGGSNAGRYTKVGDVVVATATVQWTARTTAYSSHLLISGYPFACGTVRAAGTLAAVNSGLTFSSGTNDNYWSINIDPGNTFAYIIENGDGTYGHNPTVGTSGLIYAVTLVYKTS